jgi:hypothetical protein
MMAGRGTAPKDPKRRARTNSDPTPTTTLRFEQSTAPELPDRFEWPDRTREWWAMWLNSPQAEHFGSTDWDFLLDTALIHAEFWSGNTGAGPELRLRVAKFGATPEDRARLRMQFAQADEADARRPEPVSSSRQRRGTLHALPVDKASGE